MERCDYPTTTMMVCWYGPPGVVAETPKNGGAHEVTETDNVPVGRFGHSAVVYQSGMWGNPSGYQFWSDIDSWNTLGTYFLGN